MPQAVLRPLSEAEMDAYRAPFLNVRGPRADLCLAERNTDRVASPHAMSR